MVRGRLRVLRKGQHWDYLVLAPDVVDELRASFKQLQPELDDHLFVVEVPDRDRVLSALRGNGIGAAVHYPTPIHLQPAWRWLGYARGDFPVAERLAEECLSLPLFPGITEAEQVRVADTLREALC